MEATDLIANTLKMNEGIVEMALEGLSEEDFMKRPGEEDSPIGWLLWHRARVEDAVIAGVSGGAQAWTEEKWHEKFGMEAGAPGDPKSVGVGHSPDEVAAFSARKADLTGYTKAVRERTKAALRGLTPQDLDRKVPDFGGGEIAVGELLGRALLVDGFHHSGQVCYLRGHITGFGWLPY